MEAFKKGTFDKIEVVYNEFKNVATQILRTEQFLPVLPPAKSNKAKVEIDYLYEPGKEEIIKGLIPKSLKIQLFKAVLDSNASENGARMTAMDKATENAGELLKELKLTYNRSRQKSAITKEILEIVGGAEALKSRKQICRNDNLKVLAKRSGLLFMNKPARFTESSTRWVLMLRWVRFVVLHGLLGLNVQLRPYAFLALGLTVWIIYTADHLIDAAKN